MKKEELGTGQYVSTSTCYFEGRINPTKVKMSLTEEAKAVVLGFLTESLDFHTLVCDIAGNIRKETKPDKGYEELKADYLHVCDRYKQEQEKSNDLLHRWRDEEAKRKRADVKLADSYSHHNNVMNRIKELLKEVDMPSVKSAIEALKNERANGKLFAEQCEQLKKENDTLVGRCNCLEKNYYCERKKAGEIEKNMNNLSDNYDRLAEDYNCLNTRYNNQKEYIAQYIEENKQLTEKVEKLKGKLDRASKRYGELIKIIGDKAIKAI